MSLLRAASTADARVSYTGAVSSVIYGRGDHTDATVVKIDHQAGKRWRVWYVAPADAYGRLIVSDGGHTYQYEPKLGKVFRIDFIQFAPTIAAGADVAQVLHNYSVQLGGESSVAGRSARTLSINSKYSGVLVERLWLDRETDLVLRRETYHADGTIAGRTSFDNVRFRSDLPRGLFDLTVPTGMRLVEGTSFLRANTTDVRSLSGSLPFKVDEPRELPEGFTLEKANVDAHQGVQTLHLVYTDGLRTFSLFETKTSSAPQFGFATSKEIKVGESGGRYAYVDNNTVVTWNAGGLNFTLVGDLAPKEFAKIGASIKS